MHHVLAYYFKARREYGLKPAQAWAEALVFYGECDPVGL